jgi:hypothetical protein
MKPSSHASFAFWVLFLNAPNLAVALALVLRRTPATTSLATKFAFPAVPASGLLFIVDTFLLNPDPQGAIALLLTPIVQAAAAGLAFLLVVILRKAR